MITDMRNGLPMAKNQNIDLASQIARLCSGRVSGEVLSALLQNTIEELMLLNARTRKQVVVEYTKSLKDASADLEACFGPYEVYKIASRMAINQDKLIRGIFKLCHGKSREDVIIAAEELCI